VVTALVLCAVSPAIAADRIVLRNLKIITGKKVKSLDDDGVKLQDGQTVGWDEIERISVAPERQAEADRLLEELGIHLYRIRQRLKVGDYKGLLPHAEALSSRYATRQSRTAYMVQQSLMWGLLAAGRREEALAPYLCCLQYLRAQESRPVDLPGQRRLMLDKKTGMTPELPPVWFDAKAAKKAMPDVFRIVAAMKQPRPVGTRVYYGTLALAAGQVDTAQPFLDGIKGDDPATAQLKTIAMAQTEVQAGRSGSALKDLEASLDELSPTNRPVALYWLGMAKIGAESRSVQLQGVLQLLHLPAVYGKKFPELAGAGLYQSMETLAQLDDAKGSIAVRKELLDRYGHTYHATKLRSALTPKKDN